MTVTLQKKICMLGGFWVGKTSLVKRFVASVFSETYLTTVGVKIDKKTVDLSDRIVNLILWDLAGEDDISSLRMSYLRGSAGYVRVPDGARPPPPRGLRFRCGSAAKRIWVPCRSCCCSTRTIFGNSGRSAMPKSRISGGMAGGWSRPAREPEKASRML